MELGTESIMYIVLLLWFSSFQEEIFPKVQLYIEYLLFIWAAYMLKYGFLN